MGIIDQYKYFLGQCAPKWEINWITVKMKLSVPLVKKCLENIAESGLTFIEILRTHMIDRAG